MASRFVVTGWVGAGTPQDHLRPDVDPVGASKVGAIKLKGHPATDAAALCLVVLDYPGAAPAAQRHPLSIVDRLHDLGADSDTVLLTPAQTNLLANRFGVVLPARVTVGELVVLLLGAGLRPGRDGRIKVEVNGHLLHDQVAVSGGATDSFTYSNGALPTVSSGAWVAVTGSLGNLDVASNAVTSTTTDGTNAWSETFGTNHYSEATLSCNTNYADCSVTVRQDLTADTMYNSGISTSGVRFISESTAGSVVDLVTEAGSGSAAVYRSEAEGSALRLYVDGLLELSTTDTTLATSNHVGIKAFVSGGTYTIDSWSGGALVPSAPTITAAAGGHERAGIEWSDVEAVTDWDIDWATAAAPTTWLGPVATGSVLPYGAVTGLTNGTAYVFRVRGVNASGDGTWSGTSGSATPTDVRGFFLLESGDKFLLESGDRFLLESGAGASGTTLVVQNATHAHSVENAVLTQHQVLTVANATSAHTAANVALTQHFTLTVADAVHGHTAANAGLVQHQALTVADATHAHSAGAVALTQHQVLAVAGATHGHTAAAVTLTQHHLLAVASATHAHSAGNVSLAQVITLVVADATHAHSATAVTLTQHHVLAVAAATHGHTAAAATLTQHHTLTVNAATHAHGAGNVTLAIAGVLDVHNATHSHTATNVTLTQHQVLAVASSTHAHTAGNVSLGVGVVTLVVASATHGHTAAAVVVVQHQVLTVASSSHTHTAEPVTLLHHQVLAVDNARHLHTAAEVVFFSTVWSLLRRLTVRAETRIPLVEAEARIAAVPPAARTNGVPAETRRHTVRPETRKPPVEVP